jgi:PEP-CTERM motif
MSRFKIAATSWLLALALASFAHAQSYSTPLTYNVASDWANTYPTTVQINAATSSTWASSGSLYGSTWSSGAFSYNWTNSTGTSGNNVQYLPTYYGTTTTGYETSGGTNVATFVYSVPFAAYQYNPGSTLNVATSPALAAQLSSGFKGIGGTAMTAPANFAITGTTTSGNIKEVAHVETGGTTSELGFATTAASISSRFNDSSGSVQDLVPGVYYGYATTNSTGSSIAIQNVPSGSLDNVIVMEPSFGPSYVAWTAPVSGTITNISVNVWDLHESTADNDGFGGFAVYHAANSSSLGSSYFSALNQNGGAQNGDIQSYVSSTVGTTNNNIGTLNGFATTSKGYSFGVGWSASNIAVTAGEVLWFVADSGHTYSGGGYHSEEGGGDPLAVQANITFVPEPSSMVLLGFAGAGFGLAVWKRRRSA